MDVRAAHRPEAELLDGRERVTRGAVEKALGLGDGEARDVVAVACPDAVAVDLEAVVIDSQVCNTGLWPR